MTASRSARRSRAGLFVGEFLKSPLRTASLVPSSRSLAAAMIPSGLQRPVVVELGPGTGSFTRALQALDPERHLALELNPKLAAALDEDFAGVEVVVESAARLGDVLAEQDLIGRVDLVVSGLPWQAWAGDDGRDLLQGITSGLRPDGVLTQFTYTLTRWLPPGRRQHRDLRAQFGEVSLVGPVWGNFPPATMFLCSGHHLQSA